MSMFPGSPVEVLHELAKLPWHELPHVALASGGWTPPGVDRVAVWYCTEDRRLVAGFPVGEDDYWFEEIPWPVAWPDISIFDGETGEYRGWATTDEWDMALSEDPDEAIRSARVWVYA